MFHRLVYIFLFCIIFLTWSRASGITDKTQDLTTPRANTLFDDADDIQRQLDNEARDRMKYGKNLMKRRVTHVGTEYLLKSADDGKRWDYRDQDKWGSQYPDCMGRSQSPVDLPYRGLTEVTGARQMLFSNHDVLPESLSMVNDGNTGWLIKIPIMRSPTSPTAGYRPLCFADADGPVMFGPRVGSIVKISGIWHAARRPVIYGGAAHSRRYVFHSMLLHWPSEHTIGGLQFPMESQALYISAEYGSMEEALHAANDKMALLGVASLYKFSNHTQKGLRELLKVVLSMSFGSKPVSLHPLSFFSPPFEEYVCYQGSLTMPPCTESVLWLVRARSLSVTRELVDAVNNILVNGEPQEFFRRTQPLNDRKVFFFN